MKNPFRKPTLRSIAEDYWQNAKAHLMWAEREKRKADASYEYWKREEDILSRQKDAIILSLSED